VNKDFLYIETEATLANLCKQLQVAPWLAVDTEFERERTYFPELCLLQIASTDITAIIDPLLIGNMEPVLDLLYSPSIIKVFHSARQDLEIFFHLKGCIPTPLFDTQIVAKYSGYRECIGYAQLVEKICGITLNKAHTRTNWKQRPLRADHLRYAADDVIYLGQIYEQLLSNVTDTEAMVLLDNEFKKLENPFLYLPDPETMWQKISEAKRYSGVKLAVLKKLGSWREITAREMNLPRKWLLSDQVVVNLIRYMPTTMDELNTIKELDNHTLKSYGQVLLNIINSTTSISDELQQ